MAKYGFEFKLEIVQEYLEGKAGTSYLSKKYGVKSEKQLQNWLNAYHGEEGVDELSKTKERPSILTKKKEEKKTKK